MSPPTNSSATAGAADPAPHRAGNEYPMLDIPFSAIIDGRRYQGEGLSLLEARVSGLIDPALNGSEKIVVLNFSFPGFQVVLSPVARVSVEDESTVSLVFTEPTGDHHAQLRQILNDYISGDLTSAGSVIRSDAIAQPKGAKAPHVPRRGVFGRLKSGLGTLIVLGLTVALIAVAASLVQTRLLTTEITTPGRVVPQGETLRATASGQISFLNPEAAEGEVLYALDTTDGETLSVAMPCDCTAQPVSLSEGATVLAGEPVVAVSPQEAPLVIEAQLPQPLLFRIQRAGSVDVELSGGQEFEAALAEDFRAPGAAADGGPVRATLMPAEDLADRTLGQVAALSVTRDATEQFSPVFETAESLRADGAWLWNEAEGLWTTHVGPFFERVTS